MSDNDAILEEMKRQSEDPRKRREVKPVIHKSKFTEEALKKKAGDKVWVKCVSELRPWANEKPMEFWEDYQVSVHEAIILDERRFCVILEEPLNKE